MDGAVLKAMEPYFVNKFYNPSASYLAANSVKKDLDEARSTCAQILGCKPAEITFTAGGTEANNLAICGVALKNHGAHMVTSALEHDSILKPLEYLKDHGWTFSEVKPKPDGLIEPEQIANAITDNTVLVSIMYANNEIGTIQPIKKIAEQLSEIRARRLKAGNKTPLYFHTDAAQAANYLDLHVHSLGVDLMTLNGGKVYGPKQSGLLYISSKVPTLEPIMFGGGQEHNLRSGTENVAGIIGLSAALASAQKMRTLEVVRLQKLQALFITKLVKQLPNATINGSLKKRLPNNVHITIPGVDNERAIFFLDEHGVQVAAGSACSASNEESSHVLKAIGKTEQETRSSLRITMGRGTSPEDINQTVNLLEQLSKA